MVATAEVSDCGTARVNRKPTTVHARSLGSSLRLASRAQPARSLSHAHTPVRALTHTLSFRHVAVNQVLSRGGRVLIRERQERGNARYRTAFRARLASPADDEDASFPPRCGVESRSIASPFFFLSAGKRPPKKNMRVVFYI